MRADATVGEGRSHEAQLASRCCDAARSEVCTARRMPSLERQARLHRVRLVRVTSSASATSAGAKGSDASVECPDTTRCAAMLANTDSRFRVASAAKSWPPHAARLIPVSDGPRGVHNRGARSMARPLAGPPRRSPGRRKTAPVGRTAPPQLRAAVGGSTVGSSTPPRPRGVLGRALHAGRGRARPADRAACASLSVSAGASAGRARRREAPSECRPPWARRQRSRWP
jgi:hypothetical protein